MAGRGLRVWASLSGLLFVVLAVFDVLAAIVVWTLVRDGGPRTPVKTDAPAVARIR